MISFISFLIVIGICVISHEGGHYLAAKWRRVTVHEFSFGMGPSLWSRHTGETLWSVRAFPIGGYVKLEGEDEDPEAVNGPVPEHSLLRKKPWERLAVITAGAAVNLILAWLLTAFLLTGRGVLDLNRPIVGNVMENSAALGAGILKDDELISIDGVKLDKWSDISAVIRDEKKVGNNFQIVLKRGENILTMNVDIPPTEGEEPRLLGIQPAFRRYPLSKALLEGLSYSWGMGCDMIKSIWMVLTRKLKTEVVGPVGIAVMAGDAVRHGFWSFIAFLAIINLNLGLLNLFPFPALDGGRAIFIIIEMITGSKVPEKWESVIHYGGFIVLISLIILITGKDIARLFH